MLSKRPTKLLLACIFFGSLSAIYSNEIEEENASLSKPSSNEDESSEELKKDESYELKKFVVTGSRIRGFDIESISPITSIGLEEIEATGVTQLSQLVRSLPISAGSSEADQSLSFAGDGAQANLRGIGVGGTLVLLNGRRTVPYALSTSNGTSFVDLNSIPVGALERVDFLREGESAIYGSDALAGVINFVTRPDYDGFEIDATYSNTTRDDDLETWRTDLAFGDQFGDTHLSVFANYYERNALQLADREYSASADHSEAGGFNLTDWSSYPGIFEAPTNLGALIFYGDATSSEANSYERFNFNEYQTAISEARRQGITVIANHQFTPSISGFLEFSYQDNESISQSAPAAFNVPFTIPGDHPNNPFNVFFGVEIPIPNTLLRPTDPGPRITTIDSIATRLATGLQGQFGRNGKWNFDYMFGESDVDKLTENLVRVDLFQDALNQTEGLILNPFATGPNQGDNSQIYPSLTTDDTVRGNRGMHQLNLSLSEELFSIHGLPSSGVIGLEYREESMERIQSELAENFLLFGAGGSSAKGRRDLFAAYGELHLPMHQKFDFHLALRHEEYSDFGDSTNPKISAKFTPISGLVFRASYSEAFQAPSLEQAYGGVTRGFRQEQDVLRLGYQIPAQIDGFEDELYPFDDWRSREVRFKGNPDLDPQTASHANAGFLFTPEFIKDLTLTANYWEYQVEDFIGTSNIRFILNQEVNTFNENLFDYLSTDPLTRGEETGVYRQPNLFYPNALLTLAPGHILFIENEFQNFDGFELKGLDVELYYKLQTATKGEFLFRSFTQFFDEFLQNEFNFVGFERLPEFRTRNSVYWLSSNRKLSAFYQVNYASKYKTIYTNVPEVGSHIVHDFSVSYKISDDFKISFIVNNVFDKDPPPYLADSEGYDNRFGLHDPRGRMISIAFKKEFR